MACPGGCIGGGGQPQHGKSEIIRARQKLFMKKIEGYLSENLTKILYNQII